MTNSSNKVVTQIAFLIDFNSFPIANQLRTTIPDEPDKTPKSASTFNLSDSFPFIPSSTPGVSVVGPSTSTTTGTTRATASSSNQNSRIKLELRTDCLYPNVEALDKTPPRIEDIIADSEDSDDDEWPDDEQLQQRQAREAQIKDNLQWTKEIIIQELYKACCNGQSGNRGILDAENVQWAYQIFDSSHEVLPTKTNAKKFLKLNIETIENFEQHLEQQLREFVRDTRRLEKKIKKIVLLKGTKGSRMIFKKIESHRLTCLSNAMKNVMSDIKWIEEPAAGQVNHNNVVVILHHLPEGEREVMAFAAHHVPADKILNQKAIRDALLPPAFLRVLRDQLQIRLHFIDISKVGQQQQLPQQETVLNQTFQNQDFHIVLENAGDLSIVSNMGPEAQNLDNDGQYTLIIQKLLQMLNARDERHPQRATISLEYGTWYNMLKAAIDGAVLRAERQTTTKTLPTRVEKGKEKNKDYKRSDERELVSVTDSASIDIGRPRRGMRVMGGPGSLSSRSVFVKRERRNADDVDNTSISLPHMVTTSRLIDQMSPKAKVGNWLGHGQNTLLSPPDDQYEEEVPVRKQQYRERGQYKVDRRTYDEARDDERYGNQVDYSEPRPTRRMKIPAPALPCAAARPAPPPPIAVAVPKIDCMIPETDFTETEDEQYQLRNRRDRDYDRDHDRGPTHSRQLAQISRIRNSREEYERPDIQKQPEKNLPPNTSYLKSLNPRRPILISRARINAQMKQKKPTTARTSHALPRTKLQHYKGGFSTGAKHTRQHIAQPSRRQPTSAIAYVPPQQQHHRYEDSVDSLESAGGPALFAHPCLPRSYNHNKGANVRRTLVFDEPPDSPDVLGPTPISMMHPKFTQSKSKNQSEIQSNGKSLKSKRKLDMDDDTDESKAGHSRTGTAHPSTSAFARLSPKTPHHKRLKRLKVALSLEKKSVIEESPQVPLARQRRSGLRCRDGAQVDPVSFYSYGSNESRAWDAAGKKMTESGIADSAVNSKGILAGLSSNELQMNLSEYEMLANSSPEYGRRESERKRQRERKVENTVKYFQVQPPTDIPAVPALPAPKPCGNEDMEDDGSQSNFPMPCIALTVESSAPDSQNQQQLDSINLPSVIPNETREEYEELHDDDETENQQVEEENQQNLEENEKETEVENGSNIPSMNQIEERFDDSNSTPPEMVILTTVEFTTPSPTVQSRRAKQKADATASISAMTASFTSSSSSNNDTSLRRDIDELINRQIRNTPTPTPNHASKMALTTPSPVSVTVPAPTPLAVDEEVIETPQVDAVEKEVQMPLIPQVDTVDKEVHTPQLNAVDEEVVQMPQVDDMNTPNKVNEPNPMPAKTFNVSIMRANKDLRTYSPDITKVGSAIPYTAVIKRRGRPPKNPEVLSTNDKRADTETDAPKTPKRQGEKNSRVRMRKDKQMETDSDDSDADTPKTPKRKGRKKKTKTLIHPSPLSPGSPPLPRRSPRTPVPRRDPPPYIMSLLYPMGSHVRTPGKPDSAVSVSSSTSSSRKILFSDTSATESKPAEPAEAPPKRKRGRPRKKPLDESGNNTSHPDDDVGDMTVDLGVLLRSPNDYAKISTPRTPYSTRSQRGNNTSHPDDDVGDRTVDLGTILRSPIDHAKNSTPYSTRRQQRARVCKNLSGFMSDGPTSPASD